MFIQSNVSNIFLLVFLTLMNVKAIASLLYPFFHFLIQPPGMYLELKSCTGKAIDTTTLKQMYLNNPDPMWQPPLSNQCMILPRDQTRDSTQILDSSCCSRQQIQVFEITTKEIHCTTFEKVNHENQHKMIIMMRKNFQNKSCC